MTLRATRDAARPIRRPQRADAAIWIIVSFLAAANGAHASNIFDEDWTPPKAVKPSEPAVVVPPPPAVAPAPANPGTAPARPAEPVAPLASPARQQRRAIPTPAEQAKSRKLFKEIFARELMDHSAPGRRALAKRLLDQAASVNDAPNDRFVLLAGATEAGKDASDLKMLSRAADAMADDYEVDGLRVKSDAAIKMNLRADSPAVTADNCTAGLALVDQLTAAGDYTTAMRLLQALKPAANTATSGQIQSRSKELDAIKTASARFASSVQKLKTAPDDAAANLAVGKQLCFVLDDWKRGLPFLAKGDAADVAHAATLDIAGASDSEKEIAVGDAWWELAAKETGHDRGAMQNRASIWYDLVLHSANVPGLERVLLEKRRSEALMRDTSAGITRSLLWFIDDGGRSAPFEAMSGGNMKVVDRPEIAAALANPRLYAGIQVVIWGTNRWREVPDALFTQSALQALQQFVSDGGDLVIFEQFSGDHMNYFDPLFHIQTAGCGGGAEVLVPALKAKLAASGMTDDVLKSVNFYNAYANLPPGSVRFVKNSEGRDVMALAPFGKGRLILLGTNTDAQERKLCDEVLDLIYHWKPPKGATAPPEHPKNPPHAPPSR